MSMFDFNNQVKFLNCSIVVSGAYFRAKSTSTAIKFSNSSDVNPSTSPCRRRPPSPTITPSSPQTKTPPELEGGLHRRWKGLLLSFCNQTDTMGPAIMGGGGGGLH